MKNIFTKLKFRNQNKVLILNAPPCFEEDLIELYNRTQIDFEPESNSRYPYFIAFAENESLTDTILNCIQQFADAKGLIWLVVPKTNFLDFQKKLNCIAGHSFYPKSDHHIRVHKKLLAIQLTDKLRLVN
jgi:hypothetical protein